MDTHELSDEELEREQDELDLELERELAGIQDQEYSIQLPVDERHTQLQEVRKKLIRVFRHRLEKGDPILTFVGCHLVVEAFLSELLRDLLRQDEKLVRKFSFGVKVELPRFRG